jgi:hypothetical protein
MTGYANRPGRSTHIFDPLYVRAIAVAEEDGTPLVLTGADLLGIDDETVHRARKAVRDTVPSERLLLNHSHTHAGPTTAGLRAMGVPDPAYVRRVIDATAEAVRLAVADLRPAAFRFGRATTNVGINRRELRDGRIAADDPTGGTLDPTVHDLRIDGADGQPLACWFSHGCHPTVMGNTNTGLSAEWPGEAARVLKTTLGCPAVFAQGCSGDINPRVKADYDEALHVGRAVAESALQAWENTEPLILGPLVGTLETTILPLQMPSTEQAEAALRHWEAQVTELHGNSEGDEDERCRRLRSSVYAGAEWARDYLAAARSGTAPPVRMDIQALRLGDLAIVATAAETFTEIGRQIQSLSPARWTVPLGYSNGCYGYLPTKAEFPHGGYEVDDAYRYYGTLMVTDDCERRALDGAIRRLQRVYDRERT